MNCAKLLPPILRSLMKHESWATCGSEDEMVVMEKSNACVDGLSQDAPSQFRR
jgi:hypothetical protein